MQVGIVKTILLNFKHLLRKPVFKQDELNDILARINEKIKFIKNETEMYKTNLLKDETIGFFKCESLFGSLKVFKI